MYYPDVPALEPDELELLCHEYVEHNATLDPHLADQMGVKRGLRNLDGTGVLAGITNVSNVIGYDKKEDGTIVPIPGRLVYRGIDIDTLAAEADASDRFMFEEVVWLLLFGSLPTRDQYAKSSLQGCYCFRNAFLNRSILFFTRFSPVFRCLLTAFMLNLGNCFCICSLLCIAIFFGFCFQLFKGCIEMLASQRYHCFYFFVSSLLLHLQKFLTEAIMDIIP